MRKSSSNYSENAALGSSLLSADGFFATMAVLSVKDFKDSRNQVIYQAMLDYYQEKRQAPDLVDVLSYLQRLNRVDAAGGESYVKGLIVDLPPVAELGNYLNQVKETATFISFQDLLNEALDQAKKGVGDVPGFLSETMSKLSDLAQPALTSGFRKPDEILTGLLGKLESQAAERIRTGRVNYVDGISTGYGALDRMIKGFHPGEMTVVGAPPSVGKTALAINFAANVAKTGHPVAFFSLEMSAEQIINRFLLLCSGLSSDELRSLNFKVGQDPVNGKRTLELYPKDANDPEAKSKLHRLSMGIEKLKKLPVYISSDNPQNKLIQIESETRKLQSQVPDLSMVVIDYIGLMSSAGNRVSSQANTAQIVGEISRGIKAMARELKLTVLALAQLNRDSVKRPDHKPVMADLKDSGNIEADADEVMLIYRPDYAGFGKTGKDAAEADPSQAQDNPISSVELILGKNRNGPTGSVMLSFDKSRCQIVEQAEDPEANAVPNSDPGSPEGF